MLTANTRKMRRFMLRIMWLFRYHVVWTGRTTGLNLDAPTKLWPTCLWVLLRVPFYPDRIRVYGHWTVKSISRLNSDSSSELDTPHIHRLVVPGASKEFDEGQPVCVCMCRNAWGSYRGGEDVGVVNLEIWMTAGCEFGIRTEEGVRGRDKGYSALASTTTPRNDEANGDQRRAWGFWNSLNSKQILVRLEFEIYITTKRHLFSHSTIFL